MPYQRLLTTDPNRGGKPHKGDVCGKMMFSFKSNLTTNFRINTGVKPYGFNVGGKMFTNSGSRNQHVKLCLSNNKN